jgi:KaiC/GvpD/RAD55 family RecA-like ATPase/CheY-like chemotaxis protein
MIRSGIVLIDELCGGLRPRSSYLLTGGAGAGKTTCALQFVSQALDRGEVSVMLTHATRAELLAHAASLGIDLPGALRAERVVALRYRPDFVRRVAQAGTTERVLDEIRGLLTRYRPRRFVIDTFAPFLDDVSPSPLAASALVELVERSQATALLTYADDLAERYDRRLEPVVQHAAGVFRLSRAADGRRQMQVVSLREALAPIVNAARPLAPAPSAPNESLIDAPAPIVLVRVVDTGSDDLLAALRLQHDVVVRDAATAGALPDDAALVLETDHTVLDRARALVRGHAERRRPIVVVSRFNLRSLDRARLLRDGADEVLAGDMGVPELLQRLATALRRGHLVRPPVAVHEDESLTQRTIAAAGDLLDRDRFVSALQARSAHDDAVPYTVLRLMTPESSAADRRAIGTLVLGTMRVGSGDLAAIVDDAVLVYLHGAARRDAAPFLERVRSRRGVGAAPLRVEMASFPGDGAAVRQLFEPIEVR